MVALLGYAQCPDSIIVTRATIISTVYRLHRYAYDINPQRADD